MVGTWSLSPAGRCPPAAVLVAVPRLVFAPMAESANPDGPPAAASPSRAFWSPLTNPGHSLAWRNLSTILRVVLVILCLLIHPSTQPGIRARRPLALSPPTSPESILGHRLACFSCASEAFCWPCGRPVFHWASHIVVPTPGINRYSTCSSYPDTQRYPLDLRHVAIQTHGLSTQAVGETRRRRRRVLYVNPLFIQFLHACHLQC